MSLDDRGLAREVLSVVSPGAYCVSGAGEDVDRASKGLFYADTCYLSKLVLLVDGESWCRGARVRGSVAYFGASVRGRRTGGEAARARGRDVRGDPAPQHVHDPALPEGVDRVRLRGVLAFGERHDVGV